MSSSKSPGEPRADGRSGERRKRVAAGQPPEATPGVVRARIAALDWAEIEAELFAIGHAHRPGLLDASACDELAELFAAPERFRKHVEMERHRFGRGEYAYFAEPLPPLVGELRTQLYRRLAPIANRWARALGREAPYPAGLRAFRARCKAEGQSQPTPLILHYPAGGYNCLHQDLYGGVSFPLQALIPLSRRGRDYTGGEFLLVEQRPRLQARAEVLSPDRGDLVLFPVVERPGWDRPRETASGPRRVVRYQVRHGLARVRDGERYALGIIFHDAR